MVFSWITKLLPLGGEILDGVKSIFNKPKNKKKVEDKIVSMLIHEYNSQFAGMNRDIALIRGWKPIVAKVQAIDIIVKNWENSVVLSLVYKNADISSNQVSEENIKTLQDEVGEVKKEMMQLAGEASLTWTEGGPDLMTALGNLEDKFDDLLSDVENFAANEDRLLDRIQIGCRQIQEETKLFFAFWDSFLGHLFKQAKDATKSFKDKLPQAVRDSIKVIEKDYPTITWDSFMKDVINKLETVKSEIDDNSEDDED